MDPTNHLSTDTAEPHDPASPAPDAADPTPANEDRPEPSSAEGGDHAAPEAGEGGEGAELDAGAGDGESGRDGGRRGGAQARIQELVAERNAVTEYAEYWRQRAMELMRAAGKLPPEGGAKSEPPPKLEDFDSTEKWAEAYREWSQQFISRKVETTVEAKTREQREAEKRAETIAAWQQRLTAFAEKKPDALAVIGGRVPITKEMSEVIIASELGPEIAYHLGTHPAEAARIARMSPPQQAAAIGRLEARLEAEKQARGGNPTPPRRQVPKAPPPPTPIDGGGTASIDLENCSLDEYLAHRLGKRRAGPPPARSRR